jgi:hypothetical protein
MDHDDRGGLRPDAQGIGHGDQDRVGPGPGIGVDLAERPTGGGAVPEVPGDQVGSLPSRHRHREGHRIGSGPLGTARGEAGGERPGPVGDPSERGVEVPGWGEGAGGAEAPQEHEVVRTKDRVPHQRRPDQGGRAHSPRIGDRDPGSVDQEPTVVERPLGAHPPVEERAPIPGPDQDGVGPGGGPGRHGKFSPGGPAEGPGVCVEAGRAPPTEQDQLTGRFVVEEARSGPCGGRGSGGELGPVGPVEGPGVPVGSRGPFPAEEDHGLEDRVVGHGGVVQLGRGLARGELGPAGRPSVEPRIVEGPHRPQAPEEEGATQQGVPAQGGVRPGGRAMGRRDVVPVLCPLGAQVRQGLVAEQAAGVVAPEHQREGGVSLVEGVARVGHGKQVRPGRRPGGDVGVEGGGLRRSGPVDANPHRPGRGGRGEARQREHQEGQEEEGQPHMAAPGAKGRYGETQGPVHATRNRPTSLMAIPDRSSPRDAGQPFPRGSRWMPPRGLPSAGPIGRIDGGERSTAGPRPSPSSSARSTRDGSAIVRLDPWQGSASTALGPSPGRPEATPTRLGDRTPGPTQVVPPTEAPSRGRRPMVHGPFAFAVVRRDPP